MTRYLIHRGTDTWIDLDDTVVLLDTDNVEGDIDDDTYTDVLDTIAVPASRLVDPATITEGQALNLFNVLRARFGWSGTFFMRGDVEMEWDQRPEAIERPFTDEMWATVRNTWEWRHLPEIFTERAWDCIERAVDAIDG